MRSIYSLLIIFFFTQTLVSAQNTKAEIKGTDKALSVTFHPLFLLNNAIKVDAELQGKKSLAFIAGLELYNGKISDLYRQTNNFEEPIDDQIFGLGINLAVKYKIDQSEDVNSFYFSPGLTFRRLDIKVNGPAYYAYLQDGIEYYTYGDVKQSHKVNPLLIYGNFGRYYEFNSVVADIYFGVGYKVLSQNKELLNTRKYHKAMFGYNYEGPTFQLGIKLGWQITK